MSLIKYAERGIVLLRKGVQFYFVDQYSVPKLGQGGGGVQNEDILNKVLY